ncbi:1-aminocyclopropane-1-carboxylate synthase, partial [Halocaridina rubra]
DFGLDGFRVGVIHSTNQEVVSCLQKLSVYHSTASIIQHSCEALINDKEWCDYFFLPTYRRKLRESYEKAQCLLEEAGIEVKEANSGLFLWINLQPFLNEITKEEELALFEDFFMQGLFVVPGSILHCANPGWFRLIYSVYSQDLDA